MPLRSFQPVTSSPSPWKAPRPGTIVAAVAIVEQALADLAERQPGNLSDAEADFQAFFAGTTDDLHAIRERAEAELGLAVVTTLRNGGL